MTTYNLKLNSIMENEKNKKPCHLDKTVKNSPCTHSRYCIPKRYLSSWLSLGDPTAHRNDHLLLLPSGPDRIHGFPLRRTYASTPIP